MINRNVPLAYEGNNVFNFHVGKNEADALMHTMDKCGYMLFLSIEKPSSQKSQSQMNTLHALWQPFYLSGYHSAPDGLNESFGLFRLWFKSEYGVVYRYEKDGVMNKVPKSLTKYNMKELADLITKTLDVIKQSKVLEEDNFYGTEILKVINGMEANQ